MPTLESAYGFACERLCARETSLDQKENLHILGVRFAESEDGGLLLLVSGWRKLALLSFPFD